MDTPGIAAAFAAGLFSFLSPCVLPLVPGYLSFISGQSMSGSAQHASKNIILGRSLLFVAGFTLAFTLLGIIFSGGALFMGASGSLRTIGILSGIVVALFGASMLFDILPFLQRELRIHPKGSVNKAGIKTVAGPAGAFLMGLAFAAGWSPCIGPILASILLYAGRTGDPLRAAALLIAYSAGLALPFLASGLFFSKLSGLMNTLKRHSGTTRRVSGLLLIVFGMAMAAGSLPEAGAIASRIGSSLRTSIEAHPALTRAIAAISLVVIALLVALRPSFRTKQASTSSESEAPQKKPIGTVGWIIIALLAVAAVAQAAGLLDLPGILVSWLEFSGA